MKTPVLVIPENDILIPENSIPTRTDNQHTGAKRKKANPGHQPGKITMNSKERIKTVLQHSLPRGLKVQNYLAMLKAKSEWEKVNLK